MKKIITLILGGLLIMFMNNTLYATGIMGSDLSWKCVGKDSFLIKLVVYSNCNSSQLITSPIRFICTSTGDSVANSLNISVGTPVDITPVCHSSCTICSSSGCSFPYGVNCYTMQGLVVLSSAGSCCNIKITYKQCCRDATITTGAAGENFYTEARLNRCLNPCDNSPIFSNPPISLVCVGQSLTYNPGAYDTDKNSNGGLSDSLTYQWAQTLKDTNSPTTWSGLYAYNNPLDYWGFPNPNPAFPTGFHINYKTGDIQFTPMQEEVTVMAILVNEYRNGVLIGQVRRDLEVIVIMCTNNPTPTITTPKNITYQEVCSGSTVSYNFSTNDQNTADTINIDWNHAIPGAKWTNTNGTTKHPTGSLTWTPSNNNVSSIPYSFTVTAKDNACPLNEISIKSCQILVKPSFTAKVIITDSGCGKYYFKADSIIGIGKPTLSWNLGDGTISSDTIILHKYQNTGIYTVSLKISSSINSCVTSYPDTIKVNFLSTKRSVIDTQVCQNNIITLKPQINSPYKIVNYSWSTSVKDVLPYKTLIITKDSNISVIIKDTLGCIITQLFRIKHANIKITGNTTGCQGDMIQLKVTGGKYYTWETGDTTSTIIFKDIKSQYYTVNITDSINCKSEDSIFITSNPKPIAKASSNKSICLGDTVKLNASGGIKYNWSTGDTDNVAIVHPLVSKWFTVVISNIYGCTDKDSVYIKVNSLPKIFTGNDTLICYGEKARLTAKGGIKYKWNTGDTIKSIIVSPLTSQYYTVLGTDSNQCSSWDSTLVIVQPLPNVTAGNNQEICYGESVILQSNGASNYKWMNGKTKDTIIVSPIQTTIYKVTGYDIYGCSNEDSVIVTVNSKPKADFNASPLNGYIPLTVQFNNLSNITSGNINNNYWNFGDGNITTGINPAHIYSSTGTFDVTLIVISDQKCMDTIIKNNYIDCSLNGIEIDDYKDIFNIYPNPTTGLLNIEINVLNKDIVINLTDLYGKQVKSLKVPGVQKEIIETIDMSGLGKGIYLLNIKYNDASKVVRIVKY